MINVWYVLASVIIVSLISLVGIFSLLLSQKKLNQLLLALVSLSAGTLLGDTFLHLLPGAVEKEGFSLYVSLSALLGVMVFFVIEKFMHMNRCEDAKEKNCENESCRLAHDPHPHHLGVMNLVGDGVHNFVDGLIIAGSYLVSVPVGIATTIAVVMHEVPQELADFGVLLYAGFTRRKALLFNFISAAAAIVGAIVGLALSSRIETFVNFILPFAAGGFIYIAGSNLIPELHKECKWKNSILHFLALIGGIALMFAMTYLE